MSDKSSQDETSQEQSHVPRRVQLVVGGLVIVALAAAVIVMPRDSPGEILADAIEIRLVDPETALQQVDRVQSSDRKTLHTAQVLRCQLLISLRRVREAVDSLEGVQDLSGCDVELLPDFTLECGRAGCLEFAQRVLFLILDEQAPKPEVLKSLIDVEYELVDDRNVLLHCQQYARLVPDDPLPWLVSAGLHHTYEQPLKALAAYSEALARELPATEVRRVRYQSAVLQLHVGNLPEARRHIEPLLEEPEFQTESRLLLADLLHKEGRLDEALDEVNRLLANGPDLPAARFQRGLIQFDRGEFQMAVSDLKHVTDAVPEHREAHYRLGQALLRLGQIDAARAHTERSEQLLKREAEAIRRRSSQNNRYSGN